MKKFKLLKDLPNMKAGEIFFKDGGIYNTRQLNKAMS